MSNKLVEERKQILEAFLKDIKISSSVVLYPKQAQKIVHDLLVAIETLEFYGYDHDDSLHAIDNGHNARKTLEKISGDQYE